MAGRAGRAESGGRSSSRRPWPMSVCLETPKRPRSKSRRPALNSRPYEYHESVLLEETVARLAPAAGKVIVDGTLGGGGHTAALLAAGARVIGLDQDPEALAFA